MPDPQAYLSQAVLVRVVSTALIATPIFVGRPRAQPNQCARARARNRARARARLAAVALAVLAPRPAAGSAHAVLELLLGPADATLARALLLGVFDPADELVAG